MTSRILILYSLQTHFSKDILRPDLTEQAKLNIFQRSHPLTGRWVFVVRKHWILR